jgi:uncharacterized membrane protein YbhN (UPF0104 family)
MLTNIVNFLLRLFKRPPLATDIRRTNLFVWGVVYLLTWLSDGIGLYFAINVLVPEAPPLADTIGISTVTALVAMATMILPGGLGLKELTLAVLLSTWFPISAGVAIALFYRLCQTLIEAFWAAIGQLAGHRTPSTPDPLDSDPCEGSW